MYSDVALYFETFGEKTERIKAIDNGPGRIEQREYRLLTDISWLE